MDYRNKRKYQGKNCAFILLLLARENLLRREFKRSRDFGERRFLGFAHRHAAYA